MGSVGVRFRRLASLALEPDARRAPGTGSNLHGTGGADKGRRPRVLAIHRLRTQLFRVSTDSPHTPRSADPATGSEAGVGRLAGASPFLPDDLLRRQRVPTYAWALLALLAVLGLLAIWLTARDVGGLWTLALYSVPSNTAIAVLPHEPMLLVYGGRADVWLATLAATAGTVVAGFIDHRIFVPLLNVESVSGYKRTRLYRGVMRLFVRAPFAAIVVAGVTPVPFFPFKLLAFSGGYSLSRYLGALALGRAPRYALILWVGAVFPIPLWVLVAATLLAFSAYGVQLVARYVEHRKSTDTGSTD